MEMLSLDMPKNSICRDSSRQRRTLSRPGVQRRLGQGILRRGRPAARRGCPLPRKWRCFRPEPSPLRKAFNTLPEPVNRATGKTMLQDTSGFLSILCADEIKATLDGGRASVIEAVGDAYKLTCKERHLCLNRHFYIFHTRATGSLRCPRMSGESVDMAGIKWIASAITFTRALSAPRR